MVNFKKTINIKKESGFSLVELAIAIVIIGVILSMVVFSGGSTIGSGKIVSTLAIINDLSKVSIEFKEQYKALPGDMKVTNTAPEIPGLPANCVSGGANAGDGNNSINSLESACVVEHLYHAGLIKADGVDAAGNLVVNSPYGALRIISRLNSVAPNLLGRNVSIIIEFANLPCEVSQEIDRKMDNDDIGSGNIQAADASGASVASCVQGSTVPFFLVPL